MASLGTSQPDPKISVPAGPKEVALLAAQQQAPHSPMSPVTWHHSPSASSRPQLRLLGRWGTGRGRRGREEEKRETEVIGLCGWAAKHQLPSERCDSAQGLRTESPGVLGRRADAAASVESGLSFLSSQSPPGLGEDKSWQEPAQMLPCPGNALTRALSDAWPPAAQPSAQEMIREAEAVATLGLCEPGGRCTKPVGKVERSLPSRHCTGLPHPCSCPCVHQRTWGGHTRGEDGESFSREAFRALCSKCAKLVPNVDISARHTQTLTHLPCYVASSGH